MVLIEKIQYLCWWKLAKWNWNNKPFSCIQQEQQNAHWIPVTKL